MSRRAAQNIVRMLRIKSNFPKVSQRVNEIRTLSTTCLSSADLQAGKQFTSERRDWVAVYRYPGIRYCQLMARAKFIQTLGSMAYLPYSTYQYSTGAIDSTWFFSTAAMAVIAPIVLAIFSRYINRLVGVISISDDNEWVRIGYLTFWGQRKNKLLQLEDLMPLSETGVNEKDRLIKVGWYTAKGDCVFLPTEGCEIVDQNRAVLLFGNTKAFDKSEKLNSVNKR